MSFCTNVKFLWLKSQAVFAKMSEVTDEGEACADGDMAHRAPTRALSNEDPAHHSDTIVGSYLLVLNNFVIFLEARTLM